MAVGFSYIQRELLSYVPIGFTQTRNFTVEKVKTTLPSGGWVHFLWGGGGSGLTEGSVWLIVRRGVERR